MDIFTFISKLVDSLSWPVVLVFIVFLFRKQWKGLLSDYRALRLKFRDLEVTFDKTTEAVSKSTETIARAENIIIEDVDVPRLQILARLSPRAAILESWIEFEELIFTLLKQAGESITRPGGVTGRTVKRSVSEAIRILTEKDILEAQLLELISVLQQLRNRSVHATDDDFSPETAEKFTRSVQALRAVVEKSANKALQRIAEKVIPS